MCALCGCLCIFQSMLMQCAFKIILHVLRLIFYSSFISTNNFRRNSSVKFLQNISNEQWTHTLDMWRINAYELRHVYGNSKLICELATRLCRIHKIHWKNVSNSIIWNWTYFPYTIRTFVSLFHHFAEENNGLKSY